MNKLLERNENLKKQLEGRKLLDIKKQKQKNLQKIQMEQELKVSIARNEREFIKQNAKRLQATFLKDSTQL